MSRLRHQLVGRVFGHLTVIEIYDYRPQGMRWLCRCSCGKSRVVRASRLVMGKTYSCGACSKNRYGKWAGTKEFQAWKAMKQRCSNPKYEYHHGSGVKVHPSWEFDFFQFLIDVGPSPQGKHKGISLDRYPDRDGDYAPGNVRWATHQQQNTNRRPRRWAKRPDGDDE